MATKYATTGVNDLASRFPQIASEYLIVNKIPADRLPYGSTLNVVWLCPEQNHTYWSSPNARTNGSAGCHYCSGHKILIGYNDLSTTNPELVAQWSPNNTKSILEVSKGSRYSATWVCPKGHEYKKPIPKKVEGAGCTYCGGRVSLAGFSDLETTHPELKAEWSPRNRTMKEYTYGSDHKVWWICSKGHEWEAVIRNRSTNGAACRKCLPPKSQGEAELEHFLISLGVDFTVRDRNLLDGKEVDFYLPGKSIAIEYNGLYWHSEKFCGKRGNQKKWIDCRAKGVQLITVWEDDWKTKRTIVEDYLMHKLGLSKAPVIGARTTRATEITHLEAQVFLDKYHIQGGKRGYKYLSLQLDDEIVACLVISKTSSQYLEVSRFATKGRVPGGFSKLMRLASNYGSDFVTFADYSWSSGDLYEKTGWTWIGDVPPDYKYLVRGTLQHKFGYRLKRFKNDTSLKWEENKTEKQLAALNGLLRVYDIGKGKYIWSTKV